MSWFDGLIEKFSGTALPSRSLPDGKRILDIPSGENVRELGGYEVPGGMTQYGRYVRSGDTECLTDKDLRLLERYGVTHVLDLRGGFERPRATCSFAKREGIEWLNVPFFGYDLSDPLLSLDQTDSYDDYLIKSYLTMLANHNAVRRIIEFLADVPAEKCALFHCAAGMDRTGVTAMLLLGSVGVSRKQIIADYAYSFGSVEEVDRAVEDPSYDGEGAWNSVQARISTMSVVYDSLVAGYGSIPAYLEACGVAPESMRRLYDRFVIAR